MVQGRNRYALACHTDRTHAPKTDLADGPKYVREHAALGVVFGEYVGDECIRVETGKCDELPHVPVP